jgi:hypothetical protein
MSAEPAIACGAAPGDFDTYEFYQNSVILLNLTNFTKNPVSAGSSV